MPDDTRQSNSSSISADGSTVVGWRNSFGSGVRRGAKWVNGVYEEFGSDTNLIGEALGVNPDGSVIVGTDVRNANRQAWRWTAATGVQPIGTLGGVGYALDVTDNGNVVIGFSGVRTAFIWMPQLGMVNLDAFITAQGANPGKFQLFTPTAISGDGTKITGWGQGSRGFTSWVVDLSKVVVTHAPPGNPANAHTLVVDFKSLDEHLAHGDTIGITYRNK